jgi:hypothetical protein
LGVASPAPSGIPSSVARSPATASSALESPPSPGGFGRLRGRSDINGDIAPGPDGRSRPAFPKVRLARVPERARRCAVRPRTPWRRRRMPGSCPELIIRGRALSRDRGRSTGEGASRRSPLLPLRLAGTFLCSAGGYLHVLPHAVSKVVPGSGVLSVEPVELHPPGVIQRGRGGVDGERGARTHRCSLSEWPASWRRLACSRHGRSYGRYVVEAEEVGVGTVIPRAADLCGWGRVDAARTGARDAADVIEPRLRGARRTGLDRGCQ